MEFLFYMFIPAIGVGAFLLYPRFPEGMRFVIVISLLLCLISGSALLCSLNNLIELVPPYLSKWVHPWVLGMVAVFSGFVCLACAGGSFAACLRKRICSKRICP